MKKGFTSVRSGFTLIEVVVALFIFSAISAAITVFFVFFFQNYSFSFEENQNIGMTQQSLTKIIREIREARNGDNGAWPIEAADDQSFIFFSDVTNDGRTDRVRYFLQGTELRRGIIEATTVPVTYPTANETITIVVSSVDMQGAPLFTYYNGDWPVDQINNPLPQVTRLLQTRYVTVNIRINITNNNAAAPFTLTSGVQIRSLKDNL